jgi:hypothetical protein
MSSIFFTWEDASQIPQEQHVDIQTAHRWLEEARLMIEYHSWESYDMTGTQHADWRAFLAQMRDARELIGPGVARFEVRDLDTIDPRAYHWAFVLRRVDGADAFLVPEVRIGPGCLKDWIYDPMPMAMMRCPLDLTAMTWDPRPTIEEWQATNFLRSAEHTASV